MYPKVVGEFETIRKICKGFSIARFGDGELKVLDGKGYTRERQAVPALTEELRSIIRNPPPNCLIGILTMDPKGDKYEGLVRHTARFCKYVSDDDGNKYYSSLITRPDAGHWMETYEYYLEVIKIWQEKGLVAVVSEPDSKLLTHVRMTHQVAHVECPMYEAYSQIDSMFEKVVAAKPDIALLSVGVTATALAARLARAGIQAVDLGSIGGFLMRWRTGKPKPQHRDEYAKERGNGDRTKNNP